MAVTNVSAPASATQRDVVTLDVTVQNVGNQHVGEDIVVTLNDDTDNTTIGIQTIVGGLTAGASTTLNYDWDTQSASLGDHTLTASHDFSDENTTNDAQSTTVRVSDDPAPATGMHVGDLFPYNSSEGKTWSAYVIVRIEDSDHKLVEGATVYGSWTGGGLAVDECLTEYAGECLMLSTFLRKKRDQPDLLCRAARRRRTAQVPRRREARHHIAGGILDLRPCHVRRLGVDIGHLRRRLRH